MEKITADDIRRHVLGHLDSFGPLCGGQRVIRAGDVVRSMSLKRRTRLVCSSLASREFQRRAGLRRVGPRPKDSMEARFVYEPVAGADVPPTVPVLPPATPALPPAAPDTPVVSSLSGAPTPLPLRMEGPPSERAALPRIGLCLVSCVARKTSHPAPAKDLYISPLFTKTRALVEGLGRPWFILSAEYGLVDPEREIEPYEKTLNTMRVDERQEWANEVWECLQHKLDGVESIALFAGGKYREFLVPRLRRRGIEVHVLMRRIGEQLKWLNEQLGIDAC